MKTYFSNAKWMRTLGNLSYMFGVAFMIAALLVNAIPAAPAFATPDQQTKLVISHIACYGENTVEIHFILNGVPDGATVGDVHYTLSDGSEHTVGLSKISGGAYHFSDFVPSGYYNITGGYVEVNGSKIELQNAGSYSGTYDCGGATSTPVVTETPTNTPTDTPTNTPEVTETPTNTPEVTETPTNTPEVTETPTNTPEVTETPTSTPVVTETPFDPFDLEFYCTGFTVVNKNAFEAPFEWSIDGGPSGTGNAPANSSVSIDTDYYAGIVTVWFNGQLNAAGTLPTNCNEVTKTPKPGDTPTPENTKPAPEVTPVPPTKGNAPEVLIPVTGADVNTRLPFSAIFFSLSIGFIGLGLVLNGAARERKDWDI